MVKDMVTRAAMQAEDSPFFVAWALAIYRKGEGLDSAAIANYIGCSTVDLPRLALCRRPDPLAGTFREDIKRVASWVGADATRLADILRYADAVAALRGVVASRGEAAGDLLAARERFSQDADTPGEGIPSDSEGDGGGDA